jgi:hypothetical protein
MITEENDSISTGFSPSKFMRARHPDLFSDSEMIQETRLPQVVLEYYLDTLTSRKQEYEFEYFARKLAEKELCPNLIPQTGPTGGGDGKVDTETYPVSDRIAALWYQGNTDAAQERWAFAISAKKKWKEKVKSDVENIVNTDRGYKRIFFISNQFIKASTRSEVEDELTAKYSIPVKILDRSWIIECVYEHDRLQLAIDTLDISGFESKSEIKKGKLDIVREQELNDLEKQIQDTDRYRGTRIPISRRLPASGNSRARAGAFACGDRGHVRPRTAHRRESNASAANATHRL